MADAILLDRDQEVAPTENTVGGHGGPSHQHRGPLHQRSRVWDKFEIFCSMPYAPSGSFSTIFQMPQGQAPAQKPQPMHKSASTTISSPFSPSSCLEIAPLGHMVMQTPQSRHEPQEEHSVEHCSMDSKLCSRGSKYSNLIRERSMI